MTAELNQHCSMVMSICQFLSSPLPVRAILLFIAPCPRYPSLGPPCKWCPLWEGSLHLCLLLLQSGLFWTRKHGSMAHQQPWCLHWPVCFLWVWLHQWCPWCSVPWRACSWPCAPSGTPVASLQCFLPSHLRQHFFKLQWSYRPVFIVGSNRSLRWCLAGALSPKTTLHLPFGLIGALIVPLLALACHHPQLPACPALPDMHGCPCLPPPPLASPSWCAWPTSALLMHMPYMPHLTLILPFPGLHTVVLTIVTWLVTMQLWSSHHTHFFGALPHPLPHALTLPTVMWQWQQHNNPLQLSCCCHHHSLLSTHLTPILIPTESCPWPAHPHACNSNMATTTTQSLHLCTHNSTMVMTMTMWWLWRLIHLVCMPLPHPTCMATCLLFSLTTSPDIHDLPTFICPCLTWRADAPWPLAHIYIIWLVWYVVISR